MLAAGLKDRDTSPLEEEEIDRARRELRMRKLVRRARLFVEDICAVKSELKCLRE